MLLCLLLLAPLVAAAAGQQYYYCHSTPGVIRDSDFYLVTRLSGDSGYPQRLACQFTVVSTDRPLLVEITNFQVVKASLEIRSKLQTLFRGSNLERHQSSMVVPAGYLHVSFDSTGDYSGSAGVTLHVRVFDTNGCPPGWRYQYGSCVGTSSTSGRLSFESAQLACNRMRANLLHVPAAFYGTVGSFMRLLPGALRMDYTWIGLTDRTSAGQYAYYWLNGDRQFDASEIRCQSRASYRGCHQTERCGAYNDKSYQYAVYMSDCSDRNTYACSMPPAGTDLFYPIPSGRAFPATRTLWIWGSIVGGVFVLSLIICVTYARVRTSRARRDAASTGVVVSAGRVRSLTRTSCYPVQYSTGPSPPRYEPPYPVAPPSYSEAVNEGHTNAGYTN